MIPDNICWFRSLLYCHSFPLDSIFCSWVYKGEKVSNTSLNKWSFDLQDLISMNRIKSNDGTFSKLLIGKHIFLYEISDFMLFDCLFEFLGILFLDFVGFLHLIDHHNIPDSEQGWMIKFIWFDILNEISHQFIQIWNLGVSGESANNDTEICISDVFVIDPLVVFDEIDS